ncbi:MAG: HAD family phosphatase [Eubacterium sp.]|nr:HAD family phosphatase [Eubacterium sp.]
MIQTIIFDVGEVLLEYRWLEMLTDYGLSEADASVIGKTIFADPLWDELDLGIRSRTDIIQDFEQKYPQYKKEISWFLNHGEYMHVPRKDVWKKVHQLKKKGYRIYLLSNYSEDLFRKHTADADFMNDIDGMVVSWQIHKTKPSPEIYLHLLETYGLTPSECIFFDDRPANTEAARKLGIQAVTITSKDVLMAELQKL